LSEIEYESPTQADRLAESIADSVLSGEFAPGFHLDENALADRFGVSRTPVREAIRLLASTGLIEVKPRRGAHVATATSAQLDQLFGAMAEMEATCARLAAMSMTPIERRRLQNRHDAMAAIVLKDDRELYAVQPNCSPDRPGSAAECALPIAIIKHHHRRCVRRFVRRP